ncbi:unnamed protein product [Rhizophagus irregularis]|nr:unnamed protein product [Rhizophagus irregularis]
MDIFCYRYDRSKLLTLKYKGLIRLKCDGDMYEFIIIKTKSFNDYYIYRKRYWFKPYRNITTHYTDSTLHRCNTTVILF